MKKKLESLSTVVWRGLLASSSFCYRVGGAHLRDAVEKRLNSALQKPSVDELIEINLNPRIPRLVTRNRLEEIRWTIKSWTGAALIEAGRVLNLIALTHNRALKGKVEIPLVFRGDDGRSIGNELEKVGIPLQPEVDPCLVDDKGEILRLVCYRQYNGWRTAIYSQVGSEWGSRLHEANP